MSTTLSAGVLQWLILLLVLMASQLSETLDRRICFIDISEAMMRDTLLSLGMAEWQVDGLIEDYAHYRRGEASGISTAVEDVLIVTLRITPV